MGKLESINHFSHEHPLNLQNFITKATCLACNRTVSGSLFYTCVPCNFYLHKTCSNLPRTLTHQSDKSHDLVLLSSPAYPEGLFKCNACNSNGNGFSYHCPDCQLDLHVVCASMPLLIDHAGHGHKLSLCFRPPYENQGFSCDICKRLGLNQWLYRCESCEFDAHMKCATTRTTTCKAIQPQAMKIYYSVDSPQVLTKSTSIPCYGTQYFSQPPPPPVQPYYSHVAPSPRQTGFMNNVVGHAVEGAAGAVVQEIMQSVFEGMIS